MWAVWYQQPLASLFTVGGGISEFDHESRCGGEMCWRPQQSLFMGLVQRGDKLHRWLKVCPCGRPCD
jgi:hypothetical protein